MRSDRGRPYAEDAVRHALASPMAPFYDLFLVPKMEHDLQASTQGFPSRNNSEDVLEVDMIPQAWTIQTPTSAREHLPVISSKILVIPFVVEVYMLGVQRLFFVGNKYV